MQNNLHKKIYSEYIYCCPYDHLLTPNNKLTRPTCSCKPIQINQTVTDSKVSLNIESNNESTIQTPELINKTTDTKNQSDNPSKTPILDEEIFQSIELRGFINKELLNQSLERKSNLFHISQEIFDQLCEKYHQFKEIYHTLSTEFDNTISGIIETITEVSKKIAHIVYELYVAVMHKEL